MPDSDAQNAVLGIPELREHIFLNLSEREIFAIAQRVSRLWYEAIAKSPKVQERLCLKSSFTQVAAPIGHTADFQVSVAAQEINFPLNRGPNLPVYAKGVTTNRLLKIFGTRRHTWNIPAQLRRMLTVPCETDGPAFLSKQLEVSSCTIQIPLDLLSQSLSWHGMYLTEPRITVAHLEFYDIALQNQMDRNRTVAATRTAASVREKDGLTFGSILFVANRICQTVVPAARFQGRSTVEIQVTILTEM